MPWLRKVLSAVALGLWLAAPLVQAADEAKVVRLARECAAGKANACRELARIALTDKDWYLRRFAVKQLTDQTVLARIATTDQDDRVREAAVGRLTGQDPALLATIALKDTDEDVREAAVWKIYDQSWLAEVVKTADDKKIRYIALDNLTHPDQALLAEIATSDEVLRLRKVALRKLTDPTILARLIQTDLDEEVYKIVQEKLTDPPTLADLAREAGKPYVRRFAVANVIDQNVLSEVARTDGDADVRRVAVARLLDPVQLATIARSDSDAAVRLAAVSKLDDSALLIELAQTDADETVRKLALERGKLPLFQKIRVSVDSNWYADELRQIVIAHFAGIPVGQDTSSDGNQTLVVQLSIPNAKPVKIVYHQEGLIVGGSSIHYPGAWAEAQLIRRHTGSGSPSRPTSQHLMRFQTPSTQDRKTHRFETQSRKPPRPYWRI